MKKSFKVLYKMRYLPLLLVPLLVVMVAIATMGMKVPTMRNETPTMSILAEPTVNLGTTAPFAVLAHTGITIGGTGMTTINGDVGDDIGITFAPPATSASLTLNGTPHISDAVATQAHTDLVTAYNDAVSRAITATTGVELGGTTLTPGVYSSGGVLQITGTLTLDAQGDPNAVFIFKSAASLTTAVSSNVNLINGARFCRVFWVVPSFATLGENSHFVGHLFAYTEVSAVGTGATVEGQLTSQIASVTLLGNTITNGPCETIAAETETIAAERIAAETIAAAGGGGILTIYKVDSSGNPIVAYTPALAAAFNIYVNSADVGVNPPIQAGSIIKGTNFFSTSLPKGTFYVVEKIAPEGYSIDNTVRTVTMSGANATLTFMNSPTIATTTSTTEVAAAETTVAETTTTTPVPVTKTVKGGQIPKTSTPWYNVLVLGVALTLIGAVGWIIIKKRARQ